MSSGGGNGVLICQEPDDLTRAEKMFDTCEKIIVEHFMHIKQNLCLNYAIDARAEVKYLGAAEQITSPGGGYQGNWLYKNIQISSKLVNEGFNVMRNAVSHGYRGFAGFDVAMCADGHSYIYDLNFRFNGSTTPILLHNSASSVMGRELAKFRSWRYKGDICSLLKILHTTLDKYLFLPFNIYDPLAGGRPNTNASVFGMLFGSSRDEIIENEKNLYELGLI